MHSELSKCRYHLFLGISSFLRLCTSWSVNYTSFWLIILLHLHAFSSVRTTDGWCSTFPRKHPKIILFFSNLVVIPLLWSSREYPLIVFQECVIANNVFLCISPWLSQPHYFRFYFCSVMRFGIVSSGAWFFNISFFNLLREFTLCLFLYILEVVSFATS